MWLRFGNHNSILVTSPDNIAWLNLWLLIFWHEKLQVFVWCDEPHFCGCVFSVDFYFISVIALYCISENHGFLDRQIIHSLCLDCLHPNILLNPLLFSMFSGCFYFAFLEIYLLYFFCFFIYKILPIIIFHFCWTGWRSPEISAIKVILLSFIYSN